MTDDRDIEATALAFLDLSLPKARWTHAAHFATALWLLRHRPQADMGPLIRAYNVATGGVNDDSQGYHETITRASLHMAARALAAAEDRDLGDVLGGLLAGPCGGTDWLLSHWTRERLFSVEARRHWLPPDLAPLPE